MISVFQLLAVSLAVWRAMPLGSTAPRFDLHALAGVWSFAFGMMAITITSTVLTQMDRFVVARLVSLEQFGYYVVAGVIGNGLSTLVGAMFATIFPLFSRLVGSGEEAVLTAQYRRIWGSMTALVIPIASVVAAFSGPLLLLWTRNPTTASVSAPLVSLLVTGSALNGFMVVAYALQIAGGNTALALRLNLLLCAVGIPLLLLLALRYGTVGAAAVWPLINLAYLAIGAPATGHWLKAARLGSWFMKEVVGPTAACVLAVMAFRAVMPAAGGPVQIAAQLMAAWTVAVVAVLAMNHDLRSVSSAMVRRAFIGVPSEHE